MGLPNADPVSILESFFGLKLEPRNLGAFDEVPRATWSDFAKYYKSVMVERFYEDHVVPPSEAERSLRLYFEPRLNDSWRRGTGPQQEFSILTDWKIGQDPDINQDTVAQMLRPLTKHLLLADSVYFRDNFYYCFDFLADNQGGLPGRDIDHCIAATKRWLPVLVKLRELIDSRALVFFPYYATPAFPYGFESSNLREARDRLRIRPAPNDAQQRILPDWFDDTALAWTNSRLLDLDPVLPDPEMVRLAARLYFAGEPDNAFTSDLLSIEVLPFGGETGLKIDDIAQIRREEAVFSQVRSKATACKLVLEKARAEGSRRDPTDLCEEFLRDELADLERRSVLRIGDEHPVASIAYSLALGAALIPVNPILGVIAGAAAQPGLARWAQRRLDPRRKAIGHLQALL